jgi:hypothetical protein
MIVWSNWGFLTPIFLVLSHAVGQRIFDAIFGSRFYLTHIWAIGSMMLLTGITCWFLGSFLTYRETILLVDDEGFEKLVHPSHDFFFIPMRFWGVILIAFGTVLVVRYFI